MLLLLLPTLVQGHAFYEGPDQPYRVVEGPNPMHVQNYEPYAAKYQTEDAKAAVDVLHVVFSNHLE